MFNYYTFIKRDLNRLNIKKVIFYISDIVFRYYMKYKKGNKIWKSKKLYKKWKNINEMIIKTLNDDVNYFIKFCKFCKTFLNFFNSADFFKKCLKSFIFIFSVIVFHW